MESVNPANLKAEGKLQNKVEEYVHIIREWHEAGVVVHVGYIIGLPFDTQAQVAQDVQFLKEVIQADLASFFMLTPLPGSHDHLEMKKRGEWMDPDFNKRDSFHATIRHPHMSAEEWTQAYQDAWRSFYSKENLTRILSRWSHNPTIYWNLVFSLMWYKNASLLEKEHPMIAGFFRLKDPRSRRPGWAVDSRPVHWWKRAGEVCRLGVAWIRFLKEMEEIWLQTRPKSEREKRFLEEIERIQGNLWRTLKIADWQRAYADAKATLPAKARALLDPFEELSSQLLISRKDLDAFLKQWGGLEARIQKVCRSVAGEAGPARKWLEQLSGLHREAWQSMRVHEWRERYAGVKEKLPSGLHRLYIRFDALSNRVVYSRQDLKKVWTNTWEQLRRKRFWHLQPWRLAVAFSKDVFLTTAFARKVIASFDSNGSPSVAGESGLSTLGRAGWAKNP
jgi:hypothetical protein